MVYDITRRHSFENIAKWLRNIDEHAKEDVIKLLVGNKCDLQGPRAVKREEGEKLADEYDMSFFETSAKENESIEDAFTCIAKEIMERFVPGWGTANEQDKPTKDAITEIRKKKQKERNKVLLRNQNLKIKYFLTIDFYRTKCLSVFTDEISKDHTAYYCCNTFVYISLCSRCSLNILWLR